MATTHPNTDSDVRECSRLAYGQVNRPRPIIARGGPVSAAILAGRGEAIDPERNRLGRLASGIRATLAADVARIDACLAIVEAGACS